MADEIKLPETGMHKSLRDGLEKLLNGGQAPKAYPTGVKPSERGVRLKAMYPQIERVMNLSHVDTELTPEQAEALAKAERCVANPRRK
jgi:hypothetical protein